MPITSVIAKLPSGEKYLQIVTQAHPEDENKIAVLFQECDKDFMPIGGSDAGSDNRDEETYHKELRKQAAEKGELITSHSSNPEWNPENYKLNLEDYGSM